MKLSGQNAQGLNTMAIDLSRRTVKTVTPAKTDFFTLNGNERIIAFDIFPYMDPKKPDTFLTTQKGALRNGENGTFLTGELLLCAHLWEASTKSWLKPPSSVGSKVDPSVSPDGLAGEFYGFTISTYAEAVNALETEVLDLKTQDLKGFSKAVVAAIEASTTEKEAELEKLVLAEKAILGTFGTFAEGSYAINFPMLGRDQLTTWRDEFGYDFNTKKEKPSRIMCLKVHFSVNENEGWAPSFKVLAIHWIDGQLGIENGNKLINEAQGQHYREVAKANYAEMQASAALQKKLSQTASILNVAKSGDPNKRTRSNRSHKIQQRILDRNAAMNIVTTANPFMEESVEDIDMADIAGDMTV